MIIHILFSLDNTLSDMDEAITQKDSSQSNPNTDNFFKACETAIRQYRELMETLQVECVQSWKKNTRFHPARSYKK